MNVDHTPKELSTTKTAIAAREWREANPESSRAASRRWKEKNKERVAANVRKWADKNKERRAAYARERRKRLKARIAAQRGRIAAVKRGNPVVNPQAVIQWMEDWHKKEIVICYWCAKEFRPHECQADHVIPLWKGGAHSLDNLVICCEFCNRHKGKSTPDIWISKLEKAKSEPSFS